MRTFVAFELSSQIRDQLGQLQRRLGRFDQAVRWVRPESIHLTIKFLGEVPDDRLAALSAAVDEVAAGSESFELAVGGTGCFPPRGAARVLWAGLEEPTGRLAHCHQSCEQVMERLGFEPERRRFSPHLTLGRVRQGAGGGGLREAVSKLAGFDGVRQTVGELILFESQLRPDGAVYTALHRAKLTGNG